MVSEGSQVIEAAKQCLAKAKSQASSAEKSVQLAEAMLEHAKSQLQCSQLEIDEAGRELKEAEKRWDVIDIDDSEDEDVSTGVNTSSKKRKVSLSPQSSNAGRAAHAPSDDVTSLSDGDPSSINDDGAAVSREEGDSAEDRQPYKIIVSGAGVSSVNGNYALAPGRIYDGTSAYVKEQPSYRTRSLDDTREYLIFRRGGTWYLGMGHYPFIQATTYTYYQAPYSLVPPDSTSAWKIAPDGYGAVPQFQFEYATIADDNARSNTSTNVANQQANNDESGSITLSGGGAENVGLLKQKQNDFQATVNEHLGDTLRLLKTSYAKGEASVPVNLMTQSRMANLSKMKTANMAVKYCGGKRLSEKELSALMTGAEGDAVQLYTSEIRQAKKGTTEITDHTTSAASSAQSTTNGRTTVARRSTRSTANSIVSSTTLAIDEMAVSGAGAPEVNGVYKLNPHREYSGKNVYSKKGTWKGDEMEFLLYYRSTREWYIAVGHANIYPTMRLYRTVNKVAYSSDPSLPCSEYFDWMPINGTASPAPTIRCSQSALSVDQLKGPADVALVVVEGCNIAGIDGKYRKQKYQTDGVPIYSKEEKWGRRGDFCLWRRSDGEGKRWYISYSIVGTSNSIDELQKATHLYYVQCQNAESCDLPPKLGWAGPQPAPRLKM